MINVNKCNYFNNEDNINNASELKLTLKIDFENYNLEKYILDLNKFNLKELWWDICRYVLFHSADNKFLNVENLAELYEIGLAVKDKNSKKTNGQYFTPNDVAYLMSDWLNNVDGFNICDVACGTGKLILTFLDLVGKKKALEILNEGRIYLYDLDEVALKICKTILLVKYGVDLKDKIHDIHCDFLDSNIHLPDNSKVISNPPYAQITNFKKTWSTTKNINSSKDLYSAFMEKIMLESLSSVIITPYSFIGGKKYLHLRELMNNYSGFIVSFDNVPANIFCGRKHGIFNTNTANSVRAAITVVSSNTNAKKGFRISPLIRFKSNERANLLKTSVIKKILPKSHQLISKVNSSYFKCHIELEKFLKYYLDKSTKILDDILSKEVTSFCLYVPNTCRYFTTGAKMQLSRTGVIKLYFHNEYDFLYAYAMINSSFAYWWWRLYDGGITYPIGLLKKMPIFFDILSDKEKKDVIKIAKKMISLEKENITIKVNAGMNQENIKFPSIYRDKINNIFCKSLGYTEHIDFNILHKNSWFGSS